MYPKIIKRHKLPNPADRHLRLVLAETLGHLPYVTWMENTQSGEFFWGHYFATISEARRDFAKRLAAAD